MQPLVTVAAAGVVSRRWRQWSAGAVAGAGFQVEKERPKMRLVGTTVRPPPLKSNIGVACPLLMRRCMTERERRGPAARGTVSTANFVDNRKSGPSPFSLFFALSLARVTVKKMKKKKRKTVKFKWKTRTRALPQAEPSSSVSPSYAYMRYQFQ